MLILPIKRKWLDMILSGEKEDEYREIKPYWTVRIMHWLGCRDEEIEDFLELLRGQGTMNARPIVLRNGYGCNAPEVEAICKLSIGTGKEEWGAIPGKEYYRFHIEKVGKEFGVGEKEEMQ